MKLALNGALTIGTLDGANVEIRDRVGADNFFLFGMDADQVVARRAVRDHGAQAIKASPWLGEVLRTILEGRFSPDEPGRYAGLVDRLWHHDYFLVASDFDAYTQAQTRVDAAWADRDGWNAMAARNTARCGFFSSDRTIRGYMADIWNAAPLI